jgi:RIO kinase 3
MKLESDEMDSDTLIAQVLQAQFDLEYDAQIRREERVKNKNSKISVSYKNFRSFPDSVLDENYLETSDDNDVDLNKKDWDRFDTNEKEFSSIPKCGYKFDEDTGEIVTKHDAVMNGRRNACKVMSFPPEFTTGDAGKFDMKISNRVFNELRQYSNKNKKINRANDRKENIATAEMGVDNPTRLILFKMINNQILESVDGIISTGKEAVILYATTDQSNQGKNERRTTF